MTQIAHRLNRARTRAWADQLDRYLDLDAEILIREYGPEVVGAPAVREMLTSVRSPWMPQTYGCAEYVIRDIWRIEARWWDRNVTSVHPAPSAAGTASILDAITDKEAVLAAGHPAR